MERSKECALIFGVNGYIGSSIRDFFISQKRDVISVVRSKSSMESLPDNVKNNSKVIVWDVDSADDIPDSLKGIKIDAICWTQGQNCHDSVYDFDIEQNIELYKSNCLHIIKSLNLLIKNGNLKHSSKLCIISSIWQNLARQNKLSYCVTKSALQGLVNSLAADIAKDGHLVNAILPGAIEAPMTYQNLSKDQIKVIKESTKFNRLSNVEDIANLAYFLCSEGNTSITGQFINVDLGFSNVRII
jgi:3-oxoacyl-[acyl-carrier protein] reductase